MVRGSYIITNLNLFEKYNIFLYMSMNIAQLTVFREVMETGSMSEAARNLNRTQPAISLTLKGLESSLGFELFKRHKRKLSPVPEAYYLLSEAESILGQMSRLERTMQRLGAGEVGTLHVAAMPGLANALLPEFLSEFSHDKPGVQLSMHTRSTPQLYELVSSQGVDMGIGDFNSKLPLPTHTNANRAFQKSDGITVAAIRCCQSQLCNSGSAFHGDLKTLACF